MLVSSWFGLVAPAKTPQSIVERLRRELEKALTVPEFRERMLAQGTEPAYLGPAAFSDFIASERKRWSEIIKGSIRTKEL